MRCREDMIITLQRVVHQVWAILRMPLFDFSSHLSIQNCQREQSKLPLKPEIRIALCFAATINHELKTWDLSSCRVWTFAEVRGKILFPCWFYNSRQISPPLLEIGIVALMNWASIAHKGNPLQSFRASFECWVCPPVKLTREIKAWSGMLDLFSFQRFRIPDLSLWNVGHGISHMWDMGSYIHLLNKQTNKWLWFTRRQI